MCFAGRDAMELRWRGRVGSLWTSREMDGVQSARFPKHDRPPTRDAARRVAGMLPVVLPFPAAGRQASRPRGAKANTSATWTRRATPPNRCSSSGPRRKQSNDRVASRLNFPPRQRHPNRQLGATLRAVRRVSAGDGSESPWRAPQRSYEAVQEQSTTFAAYPENVDRDSRPQSPGWTEKALMAARNSWTSRASVDAKMFW